jgi:HEAT repeat protein
MKNIRKPLFFGIFVLILALPVFAGTRPEDELLNDLNSPKARVVVKALQDLEKGYPTDTNAQAKIKLLLTDDRPTVKRKAARVLGAINADVSDADVKNIATLLAGDKDDMEDGLKALRGLKAQSAIPQIIPLLQNPDNNVKRDTCRTLAVLGDSSLIPDIKPLLQFPDLGVQKDAADAISILKEK